jgi:hypothetical protein
LVGVCVGVGGAVVGGFVGGFVGGGSVVGGGVVGGGGCTAKVSLMVVSRSTLAPACGFWAMTVPGVPFEVCFSTNCGSPKPARLASRMAADRLQAIKVGHL